MVEPIAAKKLSDKLLAVKGVMRKYFKKRAIYDSYIEAGEEAEEPLRPDLEALAKEHGLSYNKIGPHDSITLDPEPINRSVEVGNSLQNRGPAFSVMMYGFQTRQGAIPPQPLYNPLSTVDMEGQKSYVSWKIQEKKSYIPELDECREEVIQAVRMNEARKLARAAADEIVAKVAAGESLEDLIDEDRQSSFKKSLGPFTWMNSFGFGRATIGNVPELDNVSDEFMSAVFATGVDEVCVAANGPESIVYVVQPTAYQPTTDELQERFKQPMGRNMAMFLSTEDAGAVYQGFYESMDKRTGFNYQSPEDEQ